MAGNDTDAVLLLHCDGTPGATSFSDSSLGGSSHTITANGDADIVSGGKFDQGLGLDGTGDWLSAPDSTDFDFGSADWCIDFWVNLNASQHHAFFSKADGPTSDNMIDMFRWLSTGDIQLFFSNNGTTELGGTFGNVAQTTGVFHHFAVVRQGTSIYAYLNGGYVGSLPVTGSLFNSTSPFDIGIGANFAPYLPTNGVIDEFRVSV